VPGYHNKWWAIAPNASSGMLPIANPLNTVLWQPIWNGICIRMTQVHAAFPTITDTAGNVLSFALYADRGDLWPGALIQVLGDMPTTTTSANFGRVMAVDAPLTPNTVHWLAVMPKGGTKPNMRTILGPSPLFALPDTDLVRTTAPIYAYNYLWFTTPTGVFPAAAGDETALGLGVQAPRLAWSGTNVATGGAQPPMPEQGSHGEHELRRP
jgi:hypothetical protein